MEGSLLDRSFLDDIPHVFKPLKAEDPRWGRLIEAQMPLSRIAEAQKKMIKHYESQVPWYMDGYLFEDPNVIICAFGTDDEEGGRVFIFDRSDKGAYMECRQYGISQGISEERMEFLD